MRLSQKLAAVAGWLGQHGGEHFSEVRMATFNVKADCSVHHTGHCVSPRADAPPELRALPHEVIDDWSVFCSEARFDLSRIREGAWRRYAERHGLTDAVRRHFVLNQQQSGPPRLSLDVPAQDAAQAWERFKLFVGIVRTAKQPTLAQLPESSARLREVVPTPPV